MSRLKQPLKHDDLLNYQLKRLLTLGGAPAIRLCEGRFGVARMEWRLLAALAEDGAMPLSALVSRTAIDQARVSRAVERLVGKQLVQRTPVAKTALRQPGERAGSRQLLALTDAGHELYREMFPALARINSRIMAALDEDQARMLEDLLQRLTAQAQEILAEGGGVDARAERRLGGSRRRWPLLD
jgi:DNA-binding MarR family transcriptional regulator